MTPDEVHQLLEELDTRLDRLRATYEQYFVGIEKMEPHVQKKDVERRFQTLRKMQLRNTAARFRFQALVQKYTTYITYWQRVCRRIEEGTFKREQARIQRYGRAPTPNETTATAPDEKPAVEPNDLDAPDDKLAIGLADELSSPFEPPMALSANKTAASPAKPASPNGRVPLPLPTQARFIEELPLDVLGPLPDAHEPSSPPTSVPNSRPPMPSIPVPNSKTARRVGLSPFGAPTTNRPPPVPPPPPPQSQPKPPPIPPAAAAASTSSSTAATPPQAGASQGPPIRRRSSGKLRAQQPVPPVPKAANSPAAEAALRALYDRYADARRKNGERDVPFDTLAKQVKDTLPRLAEKYPHHEVSLDVGEKDGKTVLRPVVRSKK